MGWYQFVPVGVITAFPFENADIIKSSQKREQCFKDIIRKAIIAPDAIGTQTRTHSLPLLMNLSRSIPISARTKRHM
jgi:hypothetical protein